MLHDSIACSAPYIDWYCNTSIYKRFVKTLHGQAACMNYLVQLIVQQVLVFAESLVRVVESTGTDV